MTTTAPTEPVSTRYRFAGSDGTVWLGLRALPLVALAITVSVTVTGLYLGAPLLLAMVVLGLGVLVALAPLAGRTSIDWTAPLTRHGTATVTARRGWSAGVPALLTGAAPQPASTLRLPREYGRLRITSDTQASIGVIEDRQVRAVTVVLAVAGTDRFTLLGPAEQAARLAGWGNALAALAADPELRRVQWVERAGPDQRDPAGWLRERAGRAGSDPGAVADYTTMTDNVSSAAVRHEIWLAVQFDQPGSRRSIEPALLAQRVRDIASTLLAADLLTRPLTGGDLRTLLRRFADHTFTQGSDPQPLGASAAGHGGPSSRRVGWTELRTDDSWHRSFAVTGWPRIPVPAGWLEPLLATTSPQAVRTVSMHLQPVAPALATREARAARTRASLDGADRSRLGFTHATTTAWAEADAADIEAELLAGYRLHRAAGVVTCSAADLPALNEACRAVRAAATGARVELRALHGQHDLGFLASLPLCRTHGLVR